jgi:hypothetical protein
VVPAGSGSATGTARGFAFTVTTTFGAFGTAAARPDPSADVADVRDTAGPTTPV